MSFHSPLSSPVLAMSGSPDGFVRPLEDSAQDPLDGVVETGSENSRSPQTALSPDPNALIPAHQIAELLHDVRNPLTTLQTLAKLLQKRLDPQDPNQWIGRSIAQECLHLQRLLSQFDHQVVAAAALMPEQLSMVEFLKALCPMYEVMASARGIQFQATWEEQQEQWVWVDPLGLRQVLGNLMDNSLKYTSAGGRVSLMLEPDGSDVVLTLADTGSGIPQDQLERIFDPYYRVATDKPGQGLGLAITKDRVLKMGGSIEVESEVGCGSVFRLRLPGIKSDGLSIEQTGE